MTEHPRLDIPTQLLTPRLHLRLPEGTDAEALQAAVEGSLPELRPWMPWAQQAGTVQERREYIEATRGRGLERTELTYLMTLPHTGEIVGNCSVHHLDWRVPRGEIGYWVATPHTGKGYAQEAARALTDLLLERLGFRRVEIRCDARNAASAAVARALGYKLDATFLNDDVQADDPTKLRDTLVFSRVQ